MGKNRKCHQSYPLGSGVLINNLLHRENKRCAGRKCGYKMKEHLKKREQHCTLCTKGRQNPNTACPKGIALNKETPLEAGT